VGTPDARGSDEGFISVVADLIDRFDETLARNHMPKETRPLGTRTSGRSSHRALYQHPYTAEDSTITYSIKLPPKPGDGQVAFVGWSCVLDTVLKEDKNKVANGVRFIIRINGKEVFTRDQMPGNWLPIFVPLDEYAGQTIQLQLATNAINGNTNYDWAYWGDPRVMILPTGAQVGTEPVNGFAGLLMAPAAAAGDEGIKVMLQPVNAAGAPAGESAEVWLGPAPASVMTAGQFNLSNGLKPGASRIRIAVAGGSLPAGLRVLPHSPEVKLAGLTVGRAIITEGDDLPICVTLRNEGNGPWVSTSEKLWIRVGELSLEERNGEINWQTAGQPGVGVIDKLDCVLPPRHEATFTHWFKAPTPGRWPIYACFREAETGKQHFVSTGAVVDKAAGVLGGSVDRKTLVSVDHEYAVLQNPACRVICLKRAADRWTVHFQTPGKESWRTVAVCPSLLEVYAAKAKRDEKEKIPHPLRTDQKLMGIYGSPCSITSVQVSPEHNADRMAIVFDVALMCREGQPLIGKLTYAMNKADAVLQIVGELTAPNGAHLRRFCPISLRVADGLPTKDRGQALLPGLEYLNPGEPSSSTRDAAPPINNRLMPDPLKITVPMMMVSTKVGMVSLMWDANQKWNGKEYGPCAAFASPNLVHKQENHLMEVFAPSFPQYVNENERIAAEAYEMPAGSTVTVSARVVLRPGGDAVAAMKDYFKLNPPPAPAKKRFDLQKLYEVSRCGFMKTVWYEDKQKSSHCVGWGPANAPQFGVLLWLDSLLADDAAARSASLERAHLIWKNTIRDEGVAGLLSGSCCHIMSGDAPFYTGHMEAMIQPLVGGAAGLIASRNADGVWGFHPGSDPQHQKLGPDGYASQGIVAGGAKTLLHAARITGNAEALAAGLKALEYHERFAVPHGAQGWECPIYEPDVLGAAYAVAAYVDAYEITGERKYLDRAIYWAWTGMAFQYAWQAPDREPWMLYASIPVFGTTFYTHSWLGNPVQWCGLVYAYYLQRLAQHDQGFPWRQVAEGITVSGEYLQFADEKPKLKGSYPDGLYKRLTDRCPAFINPEDIILNRYAIEGHDPRIKTVYVRQAGQSTIHVSSCAKLGEPVLANKMLTVPLTFYKDQYSGTLLANCPKPAEVAFGDQKLPAVQAIPESAEGWKYLPATKHLIVRARHAGPEPPRLAIRFE
jgi:hypothetical protein